MPYSPRLGWNPRFLAYAIAHGRTAAAQLEHDCLVWPGGCMAGFFLWHDEHYRRFLRLTDYGWPVLSPQHDTTYDGWLLINAAREYAIWNGQPDPGPFPAKLPAR